MTVALLRLITLLLSIAQWAMSMSQMRAMCEENQKRSSSWKPLKTWQQTCGCAAADCSTVQEEREKQQQLQNCLEGVDDAPQLQQLHWRLQGNPITAQLHCCAAYDLVGSGGQSFGKSTRNRNYLRCGLGWIRHRCCFHLRTNFCKSSRFCHMSPPPFLLSENMRMKMIFGQIWFRGVKKGEVAVLRGNI